MNLQDRTDQSVISLAYLPPTPRQTWLALAGAAVLLLGFAVLAPFTPKQLLHASGFIPALDAIIFVTDLITASLLFAHFLIAGSKALLALACGYLFSAAIIVAHGISFPGDFSPTGNFGGSDQATVWIYMVWHLGLPVALFAYVWLRARDRTKAATHTRTAFVVICSVAGVLALAGCVVWLATAGEWLLPSARVSLDQCGPIAPWLKCGPIAPWLVALTISICVAAAGVLLACQRSVLDQWLMIVVLALIIELVITALLGGRPYSLGFYTGRAFSLVTSTVVLLALLAETTKLYAGLARANMAASIVGASQTLSSEIELPKLIEQLMTIAIENAGADGGMLILLSEGEYRIRAEAEATGDQIEITMRQEAITEAICPESLVRYVIRTRENVVLDDASKLNLFSADRYLGGRRSKVDPLPAVDQEPDIIWNSRPRKQTNVSRIHAGSDRGPRTVSGTSSYLAGKHAALYELQERETKVRRLVDSNIIGILIGNPDGHVHGGQSGISPDSRIRPSGPRSGSTAPHRTDAGGMA